jgi:hypothetical protein
VGSWRRKRLGSCQQSASDTCLITLQEPTVVCSCAKDYRNVSSAAITFRNDKLFGVDDTAILHDVSGDRCVVLDEVRIHCLQASDLCGDGCLVAAQASEDLLTGNGIGLIDGVVGAVSGAIVAIKSKSTATSEVALRDGSRDQVLVDDSGRAEEGTNGSCASTSSDLWGMSACAHLAVQVWTYNSNTVWVTTKLGDVLLDPFKSSDLVSDTKVTLDVGARDGEEAERGETVVDLDSDDVFAGSQVASILATCGSTITTSEASTMDREEHRSQVLLRSSLWEVWCLDVQEEALLATCCSVDLDAIRSILGCLYGLAGAVIKGGVLKACGRVCIWDTVETK